MVEQLNLKLIYSAKAPSQETHRELKLSAQLSSKCLPEKAEERRKGKQASVLLELKPIQTREGNYVPGSEIH